MRIARLVREAVTPLPHEVTTDAAFDSSTPSVAESVREVRGAEQPPVRPEVAAPTGALRAVGMWPGTRSIGSTSPR